ncbi:hypothetical protein VTI74DRAFT_3199 [Chaetomium olivicolor]
MTLVSSVLGADCDATPAHPFASDPRMALVRDIGQSSRAAVRRGCTRRTGFNQTVRVPNRTWHGLISLRSYQTMLSHKVFPDLKTRRAPSGEEPVGLKTPGCLLGGVLTHDNALGTGEASLSHVSGPHWPTAVGGWMRKTKETACSRTEVEAQTKRSMH